MKYYTVYCLRRQFNDAYQEFLCQLNEPFLEKGKVTLKKMLQIIHEIQNFDLDVFTDEIDVLKRNVISQVENEEVLSEKNSCSTTKLKSWQTIEKELFLQDETEGTR